MHMVHVQIEVRGMKVKIWVQEKELNWYFVLSAHLIAIHLSPFSFALILLGTKVYKFSGLYSIWFSNCGHLTSFWLFWYFGGTLTFVFRVTELVKVNGESGLFGRLKCQWLDTNSHVFPSPLLKYSLAKFPHNFLCNTLSSTSSSAAVHSEHESSMCPQKWCNNPEDRHH